MASSSIRYRDIVLFYEIQAVKTMPVLLPEIETSKSSCGHKLEIPL